MIRIVVGAGMVLAALLAGAGEPDRPRWMEPEQGFIVPESDVRVESVEKDEETGLHRVEISMPTMNSPIEEVVVVGRREDKPGFSLPEIPYEIINDPDTQRSGVIFWLGKKQDFALRLNYVDGTETMLPAKVGGIKPR